MCARDWPFCLYFSVYIVVGILFITLGAIVRIREAEHHKTPGPGLVRFSQTCIEIGIIIVCTISFICIPVYVGSWFESETSSEFDEDFTSNGPDGARESPESP